MLSGAGVAAALSHMIHEAVPVELPGMGWCGQEWDGMGWDGMGWDGMGCDGMRWDAMGCDGMRWDAMDWLLSQITIIPLIWDKHSSLHV